MKTLIYTSSLAAHVSSVRPVQRRATTARASWACRSPDGGPRKGILLLVIESRNVADVLSIWPWKYGHNLQVGIASCSLLFLFWWAGQFVAHTVFCLPFCPMPQVAYRKAAKANLHYTSIVDRPDIRKATQAAKLISEVTNNRCKKRPTPVHTKTGILYAYALVLSNVLYIKVSLFYNSHCTVH